MKKKGICIAVGIILFIIAIILSGVVFYIINMSPVDKSSKDLINFEVKSGDTLNNIIKNLKKENIIRNELTLKIYSKMNPGTAQAGVYQISKSMSSEEIYDKILSGEVFRDTVKITFLEGKHLTDIANKIASFTGQTDAEILAILDDENYIKELITKYDFLTEDIMNEKIYHPLEGYLFADTYEFEKNADAKTIIEGMLNNTKSKFNKYSEQIVSSSLSIHEIVTLSSIVEQEGARSTDRSDIAGVFYNRLKKGMSLGSDVTTYYAVLKDFSVDLTYSDLNSCNGYNTRGTCVTGLPVGPIGNFSIKSLDAVLNPSTHDYLYFVADKNGKTYLSKTSSEHVNTVNWLKQNNLWYEY